MIQIELSGAGKSISKMEAIEFTIHYKENATTNTVTLTGSNQVPAKPKAISDELGYLALGAHAGSYWVELVSTHNAGVALNGTNPHAPNSGTAIVTAGTHTVYLSNPIKFTAV